MRLFLFSFLLITLSARAVNTPGLTGPANNATDVRARINLQWSTVSGAKYQYQVDTSNSFTGSSMVDNIITGTVAELRNLNFNTRYYWRVRAVTSTDSSLWSAVRSFTTIDLFAFTAPFNNASNQNPTLTVTFKRTGGIVRLLCDTSPGLNSPALIDTTFSDTINGGSTALLSSSIAFRKLYWGKKHYLSATALHANDTLSMPTPHVFTVKTAPLITTPQSNTLNVLPFFTPQSENISLTSLDSDYVFLYEADTTTDFNSGYKQTLLKYNGQGTPAFSLHFNQGYYIRAKVLSSKDTSAWSMVNNFRTLDVPSLATPSIAITTLSIDSTYFRTGNIVGAKGYQYMIDTTDQFNSPWLKKDTMALSPFGFGQMSLTNLYFGKTVYVAIRVFTDVDTSEWLLRTYETVSGPALLAPAPFTTFTITSPVLNWQTFKNIKNVFIEIDTLGGNWQSPLLIRKDTLNTNRYTTPDLRYDQDYMWRIKLATSYDTSEWSEVRQFKTSPYAVFINSPYQDETNVAINPTTISWSQPAEVRGYQYQVDTDSLFDNAINKHISDETKPFDYLDGLRYNTKYYLRVRCYNYADTADWYYLRVFTTVPEPPTPLAPKLLSPANKALNQTYSQLVMSWQAVANATGYEIETATDSLFSNPFSASYTQTQTAFNGAPSTTYFWRVRARNGPMIGPWSTVFKFTTVGPVVPPSGLAPDNFKVAGASYALLEWDAVDHAIYYQIQYGNDPFLSGAPLIQVNATQKDISGLTSNLTYYWRVRTVVANFISAWSDYAIFRTAPTGLMNIETIQEAGIYPSPTTGSLYLPASLMKQVQQIEVYDLKGALILKPDAALAEINISQLPAGIYLVKVVTSDAVLQQRIIKE